MATLEDVLLDISTWVDQETTLPDGAELATRISYVDQAQQEWGDVLNWKRLRKSLELSSSGASVALPADFKKLASPLHDLTRTQQYVEIKSDERFAKTPDSKYCYVTGNDADGLALVVNPALDGSTTLNADYHAKAPSLATLSDIVIAPKQFLTKRAIAMVLEARADARFPQMKEDAQLALDRAIEEEAVPSGAENNRIRDWMRSSGYRIGE
jgi:hypothetical protein